MQAIILDALRQTTEEHDIGKSFRLCSQTGVGAGDILPETNGDYALQQLRPLRNGHSGTLFHKRWYGGDLFPVG